MKWNGQSKLANMVRRALRILLLVVGAAVCVIALLISPVLLINVVLLGGGFYLVERLVIRRRKDEAKTRWTEATERKAHREPRQTEKKAAPAQEKRATAKPEKKTRPPQRENKAEHAAPIDINTCTQSQLCELPGVTLADAMRAMQVRRERGGFASVDEFVDMFGIKPHFAAQIFRMATASPVAEKKQAESPSDSGHRRTIDL